MKKRKKFIILGLLCIFLLFCICIFNGKLKSGSYLLLSNDSYHRAIFGIRIDMDEGTFELTGNPLDSGRHYGTFVIDERKLVATETSREVVYVFDILNGMVLKLNKEESVGWNYLKLDNEDDSVYYIYCPF